MELRKIMIVQIKNHSDCDDDFASLLGYTFYKRYRARLTQQSCATFTVTNLYTIESFM